LEQNLASYHLFISDQNLNYPVLGEGLLMQAATQVQLVGAPHRDKPMGWPAGTIGPVICDASYQDFLFQRF
jgi:hypothetical protein